LGIITKAMKSKTLFEVLFVLFTLSLSIGFLGACRKSGSEQKPATQAEHLDGQQAAQASPSTAETKPPALPCPKPTWPTNAIFAKYPPNTKPGFNSPEQVTALLEQRWSLADVKRFAIPERRHNNAYQNLVADTPEIWAGRLYCDQATGFDSIEWYATVENGRVRTYSLEVIRGKDFWLLEIADPVSVKTPPNVEPSFRAPRFVGHK